MATRKQSQRPFLAFVAYKGRAALPFKAFFATSREKALDTARKAAGTDDVSVVQLDVTEVESFDTRRRSQKKR